MNMAMGAALVGVDGVAVEVEVHLSSQLPRVDIVGLPEAAVRESAARVRAAIRSTGARFPDRRITINLAPAALPKGGAGLDLAIAVGVLAAEGELEPETLAGVGFVGELALDGRLRPVRGALALVMAVREAGRKQVLVPSGNANEAALADGIDVVGAPDLAAVLDHLRDVDRLPAVELDPREPEAQGVCLSQVRGQAHAKRALEVAAAGGHAILLSGPPGSGKTLLARCLPPLLPPLERSEALEVARIHGAAGLPVPGWGGAPAGETLPSPPFRAPHHSASTAGLLGGGSPPNAGEVSLAHRGVLFLDEFPEFDRRSLESLRQVVEERCVRIARARYRCTLPAHFLLVAACNPCPCGWYGSARDCACDEGARARYRRRLSGPLLDRIDLHIPVPSIAWRELSARASGETSRTVRQRVLAARARQAERGVTCNAAICDEDIDFLIDVESGAFALLGRAVDGFGLSARAARRVLRVARSIGDLDGAARVSSAAMAEAIALRCDMSESPA